MTQVHAQIDLSDIEQKITDGPQNKITDAVEPPITKQESSDAEPANRLRDTNSSSHSTANRDNEAKGIELPPEREFLSARERIIFSYFNLIEQPPNIERIIESMDIYMNESLLFMKQEIYERESVRLSRSYRTYNPDQSYIKIKSNAFMELRVFENVPHFVFRFAHAAPGEKVLLPFEYDKEWILVDVPEFEDISRRALTKKEYENLRKYFEFNQVYTGSIILEFKPDYANDKLEFSQETGRAERYMSAKLARTVFEYTTPDGDLIHPIPEQTANWYIDEETRLSQERAMVQMLIEQENQPSDLNEK